MHTSLNAAVGVAMLVLCCGLLGACAAGERGGGGGGGADTAPMTFVYLKTGPNSASHTPEEKQEIFKGHMANMTRLRDEKTLIIGGPFVQPRDKAWRGIFVFDLADVAAAEAIGATDPGVSSGEFVLDVRPVVAPVALRQTLALDAQMQEELKAAGEPERMPGEPPRGLRRYVMMHAEDVTKAKAALAAAHASGAPGIIWWVKWRDDAGAGGGVIVLDSDSVEDVQARLKGVDAGTYELDGWFSSKALERLPETAMW